MKRITRSKEITYNWWRDDGKDIVPEHVGALEESAECRISEMMKADCMCGELIDNIYMTDNDSEDGIDYRGYWEIKEKDA